MRDFLLADKGGNVNFVDLGLEPQKEDKIHSSADFLKGAFNLPFTTRADLGTSRKSAGTSEIGTLPFVNKVLHDGDQQKEDSAWPKPVSKPSVKLIADRLQTDTLNTERLWEETSEAISKLQGSPDSLEALCKAAGDLRSAFNECKLIWVSLMDFTVSASLPKQCQEQQTLEEIMRARKEIVQEVISEGIVVKMIFS